MYQTKTGVRLEVVQGGCAGTGIATGRLFLVHCDDPSKIERLEMERARIRRALQSEMSQVWSFIADRLTMKQLQSTMTTASYWDKCQIVRRVSRNGSILKLVDQLENLVIELHRVPA